MVYLFEEQVAEEELYVTDSAGNTRKADSKEEVWISNALHKYQLWFRFQYAIDGGKTMEGGMVVDWVVEAGGYVAMEFFGSFWHNGKMDDDDQLKVKRLKDRFWRAVILTEEEVWDQQSAYNAIRFEFV